MLKLKISLFFVWWSRLNPTSLYCSNEVNVLPIKNKEFLVMGLQDVDLSYQVEQINQNTWGHLAPETNTTYKGVVVVGKEAFGGCGATIIDFSLKGLESSPWLFNAIEDHLFNLELTEGKCYKMNITFRNYRIWTKIIETF